MRKKGIEIYCLEFRYFTTKSGEKILSSDFVVGEEEFIRQKIESQSLPKVDESQFKKSLDENGLKVFNYIFEYANNNNLLFRWGSKGFSLNVELNDGFVGLFFGYPPNSVFKQSIYTGFEEISKKVNDSEIVINNYQSKIKNLGYFIKAKSNLKWIINKKYSEADINEFLKIISEVIAEIRNHGLK